jgi:hypothetical protein
MADLPDVEERLRTIETLLFLLLSPAAREDRNWERALRDLLLQSKISPELRFRRDERPLSFAIPQFPLFQEWENRLTTIERNLSAMKEIISERNLSAKLARREALEGLLVLSQSKLFENERFLRVMPCSIYANSKQAPSELKHAVGSLWASLGFEVVFDDGWRLGSWWSELFARASAQLSRPEVQERLAKAERALELQQIEGVRSKIDLDLAKAAAELLKALEGVDSAVISMGSLFAAKMTVDGGSKVFVKRLTETEMRLIGERPELLRDATSFHSVFGAKEKTSSGKRGRPSPSPLLGGPKRRGRKPDEGPEEVA